VSQDNTPILVACGQVVDRSSNGSGATPVELIAQACRAASVDSGSDRLLKKVDTIACCGLTVDADQVSTPLSGAYSNLPKTVANLLGIEPQQTVYCATGGNTPQMLVNHYANEIAEGRSGAVLLAGGEALRTMTQRFNHWSKLLLPKGAWRDKPGGKPTMIGDTRASGSQYEANYGLELPANVYPLFENALRVHYRRSHGEHMQKVGELFSSLSKVAATNPYAWFDQSRSVEELISPCATNRMIAYPYTKLLNSMLYVNQAASLILTSVGQAKALGIDKDKWVYLHGCADGHDIWNIGDRLNYHTSPALNLLSKKALSMAGRSIEEIDHFDIYSCFPSAVQVACDEFGIAHDDPRGLSQTGGLPYFGGPGNSYSLHAIAQMVTTLRQDPGKFGLVNANGWFLTKHSLGIYSTTPRESDWKYPDQRLTQQQIYQTKGPTLIENASGKCSIETFTVIFDKDNNPKRSIVICRLGNGDRFIGKTSSDSDVLNELMTGEAIGRSASVESRHKDNIVVLD
jgi:acetyl-CoA C-acetyltransferase